MLLQQLQSGVQLKRHPCSKIYYSRLSDSLLLFASGESYYLTADTIDLAILLSEQHLYRQQELQPWLQRPQSLALLTELVNRGDLLIES